MRLHHIYLAGLAIKSSSARIPVVPDSNELLVDFSNRASFHAISTTGISTTRFLRARQSATDDAIERVGLSVPVVEKLKSVFTSSDMTPEKLQRWLIEGKSADIVFERMRLTKAGRWLFANPHFATWVQYVDDLNAKAPGKRTSAISTLTAHYGDDALYKMIEKAKIIPRTKTLATRLQIDQLQHWATIRKDPDEVFHLFRLDITVKNMLALHFQQPTLKQYVDDSNTKNSEEPMSIVPTLTKYFGDEGVLKLAETAKSLKKKSIATKLEDEVVQFWVKSKITPEEFFNELGLNKATKPLLKNPLLSPRTKYMNAHNAKYPDKKTTLIETLTRMLGDEHVANILIAAKSDVATKSIAAKLESAQLEMWLKSGKSVYEPLKLYLTRDNFPQNPLMNTCVSYVSAMTQETSSMASTLFSMLETRFDDRPLIQILEAAKKYPGMENIATKI